MNTMIKCLSEEVQGKLRSGVAIFSLQQCVEELILNSIDAGATCVGVRTDMEAFKVQVIDNGSGMNSEDMACVGNIYHTSKCSSIEDLDDLRFYGFRGEAVASIVSLATLVEISSRTRSSVKTHVKVFKDGKGLDVFEAETTRPSAGTTVIICNFFHNMPVRRKRMDAVLEGERIRHRVEAISLMHPSVSFTLKNDSTGVMTVQLSKARDTYHRFVQIHGIGRAQKLGEICHTHGQFEVTGYIGREGHYNNSLQFLYVNDRLLLKTQIHKLLNLLLRKLSSSNQKNDSPDGQCATRSPKHKRGQELHGMYIINIKCPYSEYDICLEPAKTLIEFKDWDGVLLCTEDAVKVFLSRENLVAELSQDDFEYASPKLFGTGGTEREVNNNNQGIPAPICDSTLEFGIGRTLASEAVHQGSGYVNPGQKVCKDVAPVIPSKIPKITAYQKLSSCKEAGSLDRFRRIYGKSNDLKSPSLERYLLNDARVAQIDNFVLNPQNFPVQKEEQLNDVTASQEIQSDTQSPPTLAVFTKLKPVSVQSRSRGISLAAKLRHLKQHKTQVAQGVLTHPSRATSPDGTCLTSTNDNIQDSNNNEHPCDTALNPEPIPSPQLAEREEVTASGDWLHHYDSSVGKVVYINKETGLSRYDDLPTQETQVRCTSDVTNMAVSVVSKAGIEYRCYPFQMDLVLPFLPKSKAERVISSGRDGVETSSSLSTLYSKWNNPVFVRSPMVGVDISSGQADGLAVKIHNILFPYRFSKAMIHSMKVINQVDKKFLACLINTRDQETATNTETEGNLLVLVDQHAAHERVRLENLVADSYEDDPDAPEERRLCSSTIFPPLEISVTEEELRLLSSCQPHFRGLGLEVEFSQAGDPKALVGKVPLCFMEKESNELRRGRASVIKAIVKEYLREQIELLRSAGRVRGTLPLTVLKVLASLACHGAIKFNDSLSRDECCSLVASLSSCQLPFQCAHGRPSIVPLVDVLHLDDDQEELLKPNLQKLRRMYKAWELYGNG
ncbi:DNA mismatch repair protein Mlh3 [Diretmus argenteus]